MSGNSVNSKTPETYSYSVMCGELLFALLPFGVIFLVFLYQGRPASAYLMAPEWAFASSALFGQTVVKFAQGPLEHAGQTIPERILLVISALIVLGLVPSMTVLALMLVSTNPPVWLGYTQIGLAFTAAFLYFLLGSLSHNFAGTQGKSSKPSNVSPQLP